MAEDQPDKWPFVSVIVPFYGIDVDVLRECLLAIRAQDYPGDCVELIVVDNNAEPILFLFSDDILRSCRLAHEPCAGSYRARNLGISLARGKVIAFTDADCRPDSRWLSKGVERIMREPGIGFVGGEIVATHRGSRPNIVEAYDMCMHLRQDVYVQNFRFGATANLFTYASVIETVGNFDGEFLSGGDREWGERVCSRGYRLLYAADAIVFHPARATLAEIVRKARRLVGQGVVRARRSGTPYLNVAVAELRDMVGQWRLARRAKPELGPFVVWGVAGLIVLLRLVRGLEWLRIGMGGKMQR